MNQWTQKYVNSLGRASGGLLVWGLLMSGIWGYGVMKSEASTSSINISPVIHFGSGSYPSGLVHGPQNATWLTLAKSNEIGSFTVQPPVTATVSLPTGAAYPYDLTIGPDKHLWFTEQAGNQIGRYDLQSTIEEYLLPEAGAYPSQIVSGQDGGVWFSELEGNSIGRIAQDGEITEYELPNPTSRPLGIAVDLEGNIWFSEWGGFRIGKLTPQGELSEYTIANPPSNPSEIILGPDDNLWFIYNTGRKIVRIDPSNGEMTSYQLSTTSTSFMDIALGPDGKVWFLGVQSTGSFDITPDGPANLTEVSLPPFDFQGQGRSQLIAGPGNQMYFTRMDSQEVYSVTVGAADLRDLQVFINYIPRLLLATGEFKLGAEVQNWSENTATDVLIDLTLDSFIKYVDMEAPGMSCGETSGHVLCGLPTLAGGESFPFTYTLQTTRLAGEEEQWLMSVEASSIQGDYLPANNRQFRFVEVLTTFRYFNDFSLGSDEHWSDLSTDNPSTGLIYSGPFDNKRLTLSFEELPLHDRVDLCFDLYVLGPWDGSSLSNPSDPGNPVQVIGPDLWSLYLDQDQRLITSFSNLEDLEQAYPADYPEELSPAQAGAVAVSNFDRDASTLDSRYHLCYQGQHVANNLLFTFYGLNLDGLAGETWALDNVDLRIYYKDIFDWLYLPLMAR